MYHQDTVFPVYCRECWYSDKWDPLFYGQDYDFSKSFFEQWKDLSKIVPRIGIFQRNKQYSRLDYQKELEGLNLGNRESREVSIKEFDELCLSAIYRYSNIIKSFNSTGNNLLNVKNCTNCFDIYDAENIKYCYRVNFNKDSMDMDYGGKGELIYEYNTGALNDYNVKFSYSAFDAVQNAEYTESCISCRNLFGCISTKSKENVIFNKQYTKEEYNELISKIIKHMNDMPYTDKKGRIYKYGEFFPIELSTFSYNETLASDFYPLTKEQALNSGYSWRDPEAKNYVVTMLAKNIPDNIKDIKDEITEEIIECKHKGDCNHRCLMAFRLTKDEFQFYKKHNIPIPNKCSNCRYYERLSKILPLKLWRRKCIKQGCNNEFETSYAPNRPEIVYCERCYQQEVY